MTSLLAAIGLDVPILQGIIGATLAGSHALPTARPDPTYLRHLYRYPDRAGQ
jgi:hypothetical protein